MFHTQYTGVPPPQWPDRNPPVSTTWCRPDTRTPENEAHVQPVLAEQLHLQTESAASADKYQQVLRFYVSVDDVDAVQVLQSSSQVEHHDGGVPLGVFGRGGDGVEQISTLHQC